MDKLRMQSSDVVDSNVGKIAALFPQCITERLNKNGKPELAIDFDKLRNELSKDLLDMTEERYQFTWPDKHAASRLANEATNKTLRPDLNASKDFWNTKNLYIEGDNLDVLKILRENYLESIKIIYIDPPYNTGNDFIYNDDFAQSHSDFEVISGAFDEDGNQLMNSMQRNTESNGRFHTDWLNMIYPRLKVARELLSDDGVIFISIDDHEEHNLRKVCDEIFGSNNYVNTFAWINNLTGRQISSKGAAKTWEPILVYAKDISCISTFDIDIEFAKCNMPDSYKGFNKDLRQDEYGTFAIGDTLYNHNRKFNEITRPNLVFSIYYNPQTEEIKSGDIGTKFPKFVEILPHTNRDGVHKYHAWRWSRSKVDSESHNLIVLPTSKGGYEIYTRIRTFDTTTLKDVITNISNGDAEVQKLFDNHKYFDYPKSVALLKALIGFSDRDSTILDFFSGSATTAHAVMKLNAEDGGRRKFIMVQLPEATDEKSEARKAGYENICQIGEERIRCAGQMIKEELYTKANLTKGKAPTKGTKGKRGAECNNPISLYPNLYDNDEQKEIIQEGDEIKEQIDNLDIGFRVLKLDSSNMKDVFYTPEDFDAQNIFTTVDNVKLDRNPLDLLFQILPELDIELSAKIEEKEVNSKKVFFVNSNYLIATFDTEVNESTMTEIAKKKPQYFVMRDASAANDNVLDNFEQIFRYYSPNTIRKIL